MDKSTAVEYELEKLGLRHWDKNLMLLPLSLLHKIPNDMLMTSIFGNRLMKEHIDTDTRAGLLAFGFVESQYEEVLRLLR
jgi:hypothetical protein